MSIKIEQGIPIPAGKGAPKYPFEALQVGESFLVPGKKTADLSGYRASTLRRYPDRVYVTRTVEGGVRVWRTK